MATHPWDILIPRALRFISDIGINIISQYAFMNISRDSSYFSFNRAQPERYSDKSCNSRFFIIPVCHHRVSGNNVRVENRIYGLEEQYAGVRYT